MLKQISGDVFTTSSSIIEIESGDGSVTDIQRVSVNTGAEGDEIGTTFDTQDWSEYNEIRFYISSEVRGIQWKMIFGAYEIDINVPATHIERAFQKRVWIKDLSGLEDITEIKFQCVNDTKNITKFGRIILVKEDMIPDVDLALKTKVEEIGEEVHLGFPDKELVKKGNYPIISIENVGISIDNRKGSLTDYEMNYTSDWKIETWKKAVPYELKYQVDIITKYARDDRRLVQDFMALFDKNYMELVVNDVTLDVFRTDIKILNTYDVIRLYRKVIVVTVLTSHEHQAPVKNPVVREIITEKKLVYH